MRRSLVSLATLALSLSLARSATAQVDLNPPLPNVMLLVDSSGSMEYKSSSTTFPACDPTGVTASEKSRWVELIEVLTGSVQNYRCDAVDRSSTAFKTEFATSGINPPDSDYENPYHRPLSTDCAAGPGNLPANPFDYAAGSVQYHIYNSPSTSCSNFTQASDGLLDSFGSSVRFGLMTFDTHPEAGTGYSGTSPVYATGVDGTWSYFLGAAKQGKPAACGTMYPMEVGARNAAAPAWEGKMVSLPSATAGATVISQKHSQIEEILLTTRPYGATPIAGMMNDARDYLWNDTSLDPVTGTGDFGPYNDPYIAGGCRSNHIILLSDGEPNLDLRPFCEGAGPPAGVCPYDKAEDIAFDLDNAANPNNRVQTFVIGFAVSNVTLANSTVVDCENLSNADLTSPTGLCATNPDEQELQACCNLNRIAFNGGTTRAFFADDIDELRAALSSVLSTIAASTTSRTLPVFGSSPTVTDNFAAGYRFFSSFEPKQFTLWNGIIERQRYVCKQDPVTLQLTPEPQPIDATKGDDFAANVNSGIGAARDFYSVEGTTVGANIFSQRTIRPKATSNPDGISGYGGTAYHGNATPFNTATPPAAMGIDGTTCPGLTAAQCRDKYLKWVLGLNNGTPWHRCLVPGSPDCALIGDIFHSTPRIVGRPQALPRDESYQTFAANNSKRPIMLYTSTNDGFLHAFKVAAGDPADPFKVDTKSNNELWAFIPPANLPSMPSQYPGTHQILLDGTPVIQDVVAKTDPGGGYLFERSPVDARSGQGTWRTVLIQSFGGSRGGFFALDVTDPVSGPTFLWQLTTDDTGEPLFGRRSGTPLITTIFANPTGNDPKEIAVAVLPGGDQAPTGGPCARQNASPSGIDPAFGPRGQVRCYGNTLAAGGARSLTIVRLDTGEIIRTFRQATGDAPASLSAAGRVNVAPLDSPITGIPVAFPGTTGAIADRVFVGDRDGTFWRVDLSNENPSNWTMTMFLDAYPALSHGWDDGQPIQTPPILSVDELNNVTIAFSTGDQEVLTAPPGMDNYVYSVTEQENAGGTAFESKVNWYTKLLNGERVAGPMTLFNSSLFFSTFEPEDPSSGAACKAGSSRVWGVDYLIPKQTADLSQGGKERLPDGGTFVQFIDSSSTLLQDGAVIFGVGVTQLPSCTQEATSTDPYFGTGTHTSISSVEPGKFQLVMHTGNVGQTVVGGKSKQLEIELPTPKSTSRIDSWAAIVE